MCTGTAIPWAAITRLLEVMPIIIDNRNPFESVWTFFLHWLTLLRGPTPDLAFTLIDGTVSGSQPMNLDSFRQLLETFGGPKETHNLDDILVDGEVVIDCKADSVLRRDPDGKYRSLLAVPLRGKATDHVLSLIFHFVPDNYGNSTFLVLTRIDSNVLIM